MSNIAQSTNSSVTPKSELYEYLMKNSNEIVDLRDSNYTRQQISEILVNEKWRIRMAGEVMSIGDIIFYRNNDNDEYSRYESLIGWDGLTLDDSVLAQFNATVYTYPFARARKKPKIITKLSSDFNSIFDVPKGVRVKMPDSEKEAIRFFNVPITSTEVYDSASNKQKNIYYPHFRAFENKKFRKIFSRVFVDFSKRYGTSNFRNHIPSRGQKTPEMPHEPFIDKLKKLPLNPKSFRYDRAIGVEIETSSPLPEVEVQKLLPIYVRCGRDGSIRTNAGHYPIEFRVLLKRSEIESRLQKVLDIINKKVGCIVNQSCGLHVHFDMRDRKESEVLSLAQTLTDWMGNLIELVPESRRSNQYCECSFSASNRYRAVNFTSFKEHQTLEVRLHSGTTSYLKIMAWIRLIEALIAYKSSPPSLPSSKSYAVNLINLLNLSDEDKRYWAKRHRELNPKKYLNSKGVPLPIEENLQSVQIPQEVE